jgi:uncharacterized repeat protein (TIGR01451 family)
MLKHQFIQKKSNHQRQKDRKGKSCFRAIILISLFLSGNLIQVLPALAASPTAGTVIDNQATGSFIDSTDNTEKQIESNTVRVTVAEVAGITVTPANTPSATTGSTVNFDFTITNIGNDPTQFFIPDAPSGISGGTAGTLQIVAYDPDGSGSAAAVDLTGNNVTVPNGGANTGTLLGAIASANNGSIPAGASIVVRVPVTVTGTNGQTVSMTLGNTSGQPSNSNTPFVVGANGSGSKDIYTVDNADGVAGEAAGIPLNGDATNHRQEASATTSVTATTPVNLIVTKTTSTPSVAAGGAATYTIKVTNPSSSSVSDVSITDTLPSGFTYETTIGVPVLQNSATRTGTVNPTAGSTSPNWGTFSLPANGSVSINFSADTDSNQATGTYQNPVTVTYTDANGSQTGSYNPNSSVAEDVVVTAAAPAPPPPPPAPVRSSAGICAVPGKDGPTSLGGILNTYYPGNASVSAGSQSITLGSAAGANTGISPGDLLLVMQMQDSTIDSSNTAAYGSGNTSNDGKGQTSMGNSGLYEYVVATNSVLTSGGTLNFKGAPSGGTGGLINSYNNVNATATQGQRRFQVVRVPQFSNLTLTNTLTALEWNGKVGGIVVADIAGQLNFNGRTIDGINRGFRAGYSQKNFSGNSLLAYVGTNSATIGAGKGEGTAGTPQFVWNGTLPVDNGSQGYPNGDYGRGAPANAGGGGNFHNAGGGGGGNGGVGGKGGIPWQGAGGALDSGGRGGALSSLFAPDPTRLFLGGGGGGGDANNATTGVRGGVGAALVILRSGVMVGSGIINVTGDAGDVGAFGGAPDGAGGGGAGGTVLVAARQNNSTANISILANGGAGGNTLNDGGNEHGPGAGGGGGVVLHNVPGAALNPSVLGGANGRAAGGTGIAHGATPGQDGQIAPITNDPFATVNDDGCLPKLTVWKSTTTPKISQGGVATYKITVSNGPGRTAATGVDIQDVLPTGFTYNSTIAINLGTGVTRTTSTNPTAGSTTATWGKFDIPSGDKVEITFQATSNATIAPGTYQNPVIAKYLDPKRVNPNDTISTEYDDAANAGEDVTVVAPVSSNPNVLVVKRITAINGATTTFGGDSLVGYIDAPTNPYDDNTITIPTQPTPTDPPKDTDKWPSLTSFMLGGINGGNVKPSDEIEYTIYFLSAGDATAPKVLICDRVPDNVTFLPTAFNSFATKNSSGLSGGDRGIIWQYNGNTESLTNTKDGDAAQYFPPGVEPSTVYNDPNNPSKKVVNCGGANTNGAIVVNLGDLPNATGSGIPATSYGFIRFRGWVK